MDKPKTSKKDAIRDKDATTELLKSLEHSTPEEKLSHVAKLHVRTLQELRTHEKQMEAVLREKENLQREYNKSVLMRDKLQEVCREQQKLIKSVKNESTQKIREEEERRKETQTKFQSSLNEITKSLSKNNDENMKLRDHNIEMTKQLKHLSEQYHIREKQCEKLNEQVQLEAQLSQAKLTKFQVEKEMEKEILIKEKQIALEKLLMTQKKVKELTEHEMALKEQLDIYTAKYDDFQNSLQKSNNVFATYKTEMEKMSKHTKKLERECIEWKHRWEKANATLIELATEKGERDDHVMRCNKQVEQLQKLLRALQNERTHLYCVLRDNNVECPPMPVLPPEPAPLQPLVVSGSNATDKAKMELMSKNCAELKETLAHLQKQMKYLNLKGAEAEAQTQAHAQAKQVQLQQEDVAKKRQKKKQKSKTNKKGTCNLKKESSLTDEIESEASATAFEETKLTSADVVANKGSLDNESNDNNEGNIKSNITDAKLEETKDSILTVGGCATKIVEPVASTPSAEAFTQASEQKEERNAVVEAVLTKAAKPAPTSPPQANPTKSVIAPEQKDVSTTIAHAEELPGTVDQVAIPTTESVPN